MKLILRILLTALAVVILAELLPGVDVDSFGKAIIVAIVLGFLEFFSETLFDYTNLTHNNYNIGTLFVNCKCHDYTVS